MSNTRCIPCAAKAAADSKRYRDRISVSGKYPPSALQKKKIRALARELKQAKRRYEQAENERDTFRDLLHDIKGGFWERRCHELQAHVDDQEREIAEMEAQSVRIVP